MPTRPAITAYTPDEPLTDLIMSAAEPGGVRWRNGTLEQEWITKLYQPSFMAVPLRTMREWKPVPAVDDETP